MFRPTATLVMNVGGKIYYPCLDDSLSSRSFFGMIETEHEVFLRNRSA